MNRPLLIIGLSLLTLWGVLCPLPYLLRAEEWKRMAELQRAGTWSQTGVINPQGLTVWSCFDGLFYLVGVVGGWELLFTTALLFCFAAVLVKAKRLEFVVLSVLVFSLILVVGFISTHHMASAIVQALE